MSLQSAPSLRGARAFARILYVISDREGVAPSDLLAASRGRARIAAARQLAMYLCHVGAGRSLTDVGLFFGRDRTTVAHACRLIEDRRDDPVFDGRLDELERISLAQDRGAGVGG